MSDDVVTSLSMTIVTMMTKVYKSLLASILKRSQDNKPGWASASEPWHSYKSQTGLKEHTNDGHHGQSAVGKLCWQLLRLLLRVGRSQDLEAIVTRGASLVVIEATAELNKAKVGSNLSPSCNWNLGDCCKSVGNVSELQACGWRQESRPECKWPVDLVPIWKTCEIRKSTHLAFSSLRLTLSHSDSMCSLLTSCFFAISACMILYVWTC